MGEPTWPSLASSIEMAVRGRFVRRVVRPDPWCLGLEVEAGVTLGFCWHPASIAAGICEFAWPRMPAPDLLRSLLMGARIVEVSPLEGEPILRIGLSGSRAASFVFEALGRSANALLLTAGGDVVWSGRILGGPARTGRTGESWALPPARTGGLAPAPPPGDPAGRLGLGMLERGRARALNLLGKQEKALLRRGEAVRGDLLSGGDADHLSRLAQGLLASGALSLRGAASREVVDYDQDPPGRVLVELAPALSVKENAERLFRRARKARSRQVEAERILRGVAEALDALRRERLRLESSCDLSDFFIPGQAGRARKAGAKRSDLPAGVCRVSLPVGFAGYGGKNAEGNHAVSFRIGRGGDFWFHAADYPGAHVVVKNPSRLDCLPPEVESAAAFFAARHSRAPAGGRVAVVATLCKHLRPFPGQVGQVFLSGGRTLFVDLPRR